MKPTVTVDDSCWPSAATSPVGPPGIVSDSWEPGTSGPLATNCRSSAESCDQLPATAGENDGIGLVGASGVERSTVIVADGTTLVAPVAGVVPTTSSGTMAGVPVAAAVPPCGEWR